MSSCTFNGSPSRRAIDLHSLPAIQSSASKCERHHVQEPEGMCCEIDSSVCKQLEMEGLEGDPVPKQLATLAEGFSFDWTDLKRLEKPDAPWPAWLLELSAVIG